MEKLHFEARGTFQASPEALWPFVADTARMNRAIGLPPIEFTTTSTPDGGSQTEARMRILGVPLSTHTEHPFRWEAPHGFVVVRDFHSGPLVKAWAGAKLKPVEGGTEVTIYGDFLPRNALGAFLVKRVVGPRSVKRAIAQCGRFEQFLLGKAPHPYPGLLEKNSLPPQAVSAAATLAQDGVDEQAIERLRQHLAEAPDEDVVHMRAFELSDRWGLDRRQTLALFLRATTSGLLVMTWDVLCPNCRVGKSEYFALRDLNSQAHCETCNLTFNAEFDRSVEVRFSVAPALRRVASVEFCVGGPMNTPHIVAQTPLLPGATERLTTSLAAGAYRLRARGSRGHLVLDALPPEAGSEEPSGPSEATTLSVGLSQPAFEPSAADVPAGPLVLELRNESGRELVAILESSAWPDTITTAAYVSTMQEFRDLFSSEVLAPGLQLGIQNLAFMFTDLTGSTAMYQAVGQARASRLVQDHFRVIGAAINANRGAIVKTIGDAVMATFPSGADALAGALQIQRDIRALAVPDGIDASHFVKVGLHQGACLAVNLNERLDYFGTTVNTAARIEHECSGGMIVASLPVCESPEARAMLESSGASYEEAVVRLRGISAPVEVYRITLG